MAHPTIAEAERILAASVAPLSRLDPLYAEAHAFLDAEGECLNEYELERWLTYLHPDLRYLVPVRQSVTRREGDGVSAGHHHLNETYPSLKFRVERLLHDAAWAENPTSRTRRFVTGVQVRAVNDCLAVSSNMLLLRNRGTAADSDVLSCKRRDVLRRSDSGAWSLFYRQVVLDHSTLGTANLAILF